MEGRRRRRVAVATHLCLHSGPGTSRRSPAASALSPLSSGCATYWPGSTSSLSPWTDGNPGHSTGQVGGKRKDEWKEGGREEENGDGRDGNDEVGKQ